MDDPLCRLSLTDYFEWEETQVERHEFYRGKIFEMGGDTAAQQRVVANLSRRFIHHLEGTSCLVFINSMKLQVADDGCFYPGLMLTCDTAFTGHEIVVTDPVLIIEVLSPSTQGYDRRNKFVLYRRLASLREYVLIDPFTRVVETFSALDDGAWRVTDQTRSDELELVSIDCKLPMAWVFKGVEADVS